jgi:proteasome lid subunit RPN8/RPN11
VEIRVTGTRGPDPTPLPPPGLREGTTILRPAKRPPPGLGVFIARSAMEGILTRAQQGGEREVGGFLLGGLHSYGGRRYVDISVQVPATTARGGRAHLTFSNDTLREFHATHAERHPGKVVLGWYHTHPGYGLFLSADDLFIQRGFYAADHHVALVVDPFAGPKENTGVFVWDGRDVTEAASDVVVYEQEIVARERDRSGRAREPRDKRRQPGAHGSSEERPLPPTSDGRPRSSRRHRRGGG